MRRNAGAVCVCMAMLAAAAARSPGGELKEILPKVKGNVALVTFYSERENGAKDKVQVIGVVVDSGGMVAVHGGYFPKHLPLSKFSDIKIKYCLEDKEAKDVAAEYVNRDEDLQAAALRPAEKIEAKPLPIEAADPKAMAPGDPVFTLALLPEPHGFAPTFCTGHVARWVEKPSDLLLTTPMLGAQPGAPVYDMDGRFLGMVCRDPLAARFGGAPTVMPSGRLKRFFESPAEKKIRPWMGLRHMQPLTPDLAKGMELPDKTDGVIAGQILPGGPAEAAGMKAKDIIVNVAGEPVVGKNDNDVRAFMERLKALKVGEAIDVTVLRDKKETTLKFAPTAWPKEEGEAPRHEDKTLGMVVRELLYWDKLDRQLPQESKGLFVQYAKPGAWPQLGGLASGDILQKIDETVLGGSGPETIEQFKKISEDLKKDKKKKFVFFVSRGTRGENSTYINIEADWEKAVQGK